MILTISEYFALGRWRRLFYRLRSHPLTVYGLSGPCLFLLVHRFPYSAPKSWRRERRGVYLMNLALCVELLAVATLVGWKALVLVQLPIVWIYSSATVWLFVVQHCFEDTYWRRTPEWDPLDASVSGSSFCELPRWLDWLTLHVGYHHVHHVNPRVPNYSLRRCHEEIDRLRETPPLSLRAGLRSPLLALWDETRHKLIGFGELPQDAAS